MYRQLAADEPPPSYDCERAYDDPDGDGLTQQTPVDGSLASVVDVPLDVPEK